MRVRCDMRKPKRKYEVYLVGDGYGVYAKEYCRDFMGTTWAVSPKQAISNVRFQNRDRDNPYGGPSSWELGDILDEGYVHFHYVAMEA